jgi:hypothetical protein
MNIKTSEERFPHTVYCSSSKILFNDVGSGNQNGMRGQEE